jgi:thioredoxin reductase
MEAGFDGVEVHGAHEYLIHEFLSPYCNKRQDAYGGDLTKRCLFAEQVVAQVRRAVGAEAIVSFRLSGDDHVADGLLPSDAAEIARVLQGQGVDLFSITGGVYETPHMVVPPTPTPPGTHIPAARIIKQAVEVPVAGVGRIRNAAEAETALADLDMVAVGRAFVADPLWLQNANTGRESLTRPCIGCNQGCIDRVLKGTAMSCVANPWVGMEGEAVQLKPAEEPATVVVVGAGLAGMEAARTLGDLGHEVVLFESDDALGGQLRLASQPPGKSEFHALVDYYANALAELNQVEVRLSQEATVDLVCEVKPQAVVIATGSDLMMPDLPGVEQAPLVGAREVLDGSASVGQRVAVLGGGNLGSEVAHFLAVRGHEVAIIELGLGIGNDLGPARRYYLRRELMKYRVRRYVRAKVRRLFADRVSFLHTRRGGDRELTQVGPLDTFVSAMGAKPNERLFLALESKVSAIYLVGDALSPAGMGQATSEGAKVAMTIHRLAAEGKLAQPPGRTC